MYVCTFVDKPKVKFAIAFGKSKKNEKLKNSFKALLRRATIGVIWNIKFFKILPKTGKDCFPLKYSNA